MRAILLTSITTIAGLLAMAIGIPEFSIAWSPLATCFIAGLTMSTFMTLLVVPVMYLLLERLKGNREPMQEAT
jgi:HAE1 family hydrophobic/amphiphilic exporter-1